MHLAQVACCLRPVVVFLVSVSVVVEAKVQGAAWMQPEKGSRMSDSATASEGNASEPGPHVAALGVGAAGKPGLRL